MRKRVLVLALAVCVIVPAPWALAIPVTDHGALIQRGIDHVKRLFEIVQRATQLANDVQKLEFWIVNTLKLEQIPFRGDLIEIFELQAELVHEFDELRGEYQALSHALSDVGHEFDITFPGWRSFSEMAGNAALSVQSEAGSYTFEAPLEWEKYQAGRSRQLHRQSLVALQADRNDALANLGQLDNLKIAMGTVEGQVQTQEMQTAFQAFTAEQLIAMRLSLQQLQLLLTERSANQASREAQTSAGVEAAMAELERQLIARWGSLTPEVDPNGVPLFPAWMVGY